jgi:flotillin
MPFRDDRDAAHARADALERELAATRAELEALRRPAPAPGDRGGRAAAFVVVAIAIVGGFGAMAAVLGGWLELAIVIAVVAIALLGLAFVLDACVVVVAPHEAAVLSGRPHRRPDGGTVGYRIVTAGRAVRLPIVERVDRIDLRPIETALRISGAHVGGGRRVDLAATARIGFDRDHLEDAVDRFLGRPRDDVAQVARETLEGCARDVCAPRTFAELTANPTKLADDLTGAVAPDLARLGLALEAVTIDRVTDTTDGA